LLNRHRGNLELAVASSNAGPSAVARYNNAIPPYEETRQYVRKIKGLLGRLEDAAGDD